MIYQLANQLKYEAIKHPMVNMASFGSLSLYDDKATIAYPYVNFDVIRSNVRSYLNTYTVRMYVVDRNDPYIAYNKCEVIINNILKSKEIDNYSIEYFTLEYKDIVNGAFVDFNIDVRLDGNCVYDSLFNDNLLLENGGFVLQENGDLIILE